MAASNSARATAVCPALSSLRPFLNASSAGLQRTPLSRALSGAPSRDCAGRRSGAELPDVFFIDLVLRPVVGRREDRAHERLFLVAAKLALDLLAGGGGSGGVGRLLLHHLEHYDRARLRHDGAGDPALLRCEG